MIKQILFTAALAAALAPAAVSASPETGSSAPTLALPTATGSTISLSSLKGQPVYLDFFAAWCPYCNDEASTLEALEKTYGKNVAFIAVDEEESAQVAQQFAEKYGLTYPIALDANGSAGDAFGAEALPMNVFINRDGVVSQIQMGEMSQSQIQAALNTIS